MNKLIATLALAAVVLPPASVAADAARFGQGSRPTTQESAPTADGRKTFFKYLQMNCSGAACYGQFKGKAGRLMTITEIQCAAGSGGQAQGGQVNVEAALVEFLPIASHSSGGASEVAIVKTPTNFVLDGPQKANISLFFFDAATFATCIAKGFSTPS